MGLRVLHVWNTAGVASVVAKFCDRQFGIKSTVITRRAADKVGLTTYGTAYGDGPARFFARALLMARSADIVHVHSLDRILPWLRRLYEGKPLVIHYHGTDIEGRWKEKENRWKAADAIVCSTPNLLEGAPSSAVQIPNPVDTDIFRPSGVDRHPASALSFRYGMDLEAGQAAERLGLNLTWIDRWSVQHDKMPETLSRFSYFIDLRRPPGHQEARSVGKAALEALACGCRVIVWSGKTLEGLPDENRPENVATKWHELYQSLVKS
ncbi:MAG TPA: glycosyltransferase [Nitrososphaerales archaeon]|nr:glycosyltransferase [Nitrososphaerales archaeon]